MAVPIVARTGRTRRTSAGSPPAMIASLASTARFTPPETGASTSPRPRGASSAPSCCVSTGDEELMSTTTAPRASADATPPSRTVLRTIFPSGSMVMTISAPAAASAADGARTTPGCASANAAIAAAERSWARTVNPAATRWAAIGAPIFPRPMKATAAGGARGRSCVGSAIALSRPAGLSLVPGEDLERDGRGVLDVLHAGRLGAIGVVGSDALVDGPDLGEAPAEPPRLRHRGRPEQRDPIVHDLQELAHHVIPAGLEEGVVEGRLRLDEGAALGARGRLQRVDRLPDPRELSIAGAERAPSPGEPLEQRAHLVELPRLLDGYGGDDWPAVRHGDDQPLGFELPERLTHGGAAHREERAELALHESLTRAEPAGGDRVPELLLDLDPERDRLAGDLQISSGGIHVVTHIRPTCTRCALRA